MFIHTLTICLVMLGASFSLFGQNYVDYPLFGPYEEDHSSYHIKVRFVYLDGSTNDENASWWKTASTANTGGDFILEQQSTIALQRLNSAFNAHGIYFLPDGPGLCNAAVVYDTYVGEGLDIEALRDHQQSAQDLAALNIYVTGDATGSSEIIGGDFNGQAGGLPGNYIFLEGVDEIGGGRTTRHQFYHPGA